ncbi:MAG: sorbosone dehydrogenase family protein [Burkholderiaceae bacterium]
MRLAILALSCAVLAACSTGQSTEASSGPSSDPSTVGPQPALPAPHTSWLPTMNIAPAQGWGPGRQPSPAAGLAVTPFAQGLDHPRWLHVLPNGDVLVAETNGPKPPPQGFMAWARGLVMKRAGAGVPSADRITLLRDTDGDGVADQRSVFIDGLKSPFGMALRGDTLYIANADEVVRLPYQAGQTHSTAAPVHVADLPAGRNHHWTKNLIVAPDGRHLFVTVGSNSNVGENGMAEEVGRAAIWLLDADTGQRSLYAGGLRNPNGMAYAPGTKALWVVVNERDELGDNLVPDYLTSVHEGGFYGWPYSYWGGHVDERVQPPKPELVANARAPDYALGAHVAALGLAAADGLDAWPAPLRHGMFIGEHGSWNRKRLAGYKVVFVPFVDGQPAGQPTDVLAGFVDSQGRAQGRPVGLALDGRGGLLVADDVGNSVWRVAPARP